MNEAAQIDRNTAGRIKVFISYSRKDHEFADGFRQALIDANVETSFDIHDIMKGERWQDRLRSLIEVADAMIFLISPDSIASEVCMWEINEAQLRGKRLLPVFCRPTDLHSLPPQLQARQYTFLETENQRQEELPKLLEALAQDAEWVREHTRLLDLALRWERAKQPARLLLRGTDITAAETWRDSRTGTAPAPTELHLTYLSESRKAATRRLSIWLSGSLVGSLLVVSLSIALAFSLRESKQQTDIAQARLQSTQAQLIAKDRRAALDESLVRAFEAMRRLRTHQQSSADAERTIHEALRLLPPVPKLASEVIQPLHRLSISQPGFDTRLRANATGLCIDQTRKPHLLAPCRDGQTSIEILAIDTQEQLAFITHRAGLICQLDFRDATVLSQSRLRCTSTPNAQQSVDLLRADKPFVQFSQSQSAVFIASADNSQVRICSIQSGPSINVNCQQLEGGVALSGLSRKGELIARRGADVCRAIIGTDWRCIPLIDAAGPLTQMLRSFVSLDGRVLAIPFEEGVSIHNIDTGRRLMTIGVRSVIDIVFNPASTLAILRTFMSGARLEAIVYDIERNAEHFRSIHDGRISEIAFHPRLPLMATASGLTYPSDGVVSIWDTRTGQEVRRLLQRGDPEAIRFDRVEPILAVTYSPWDDEAETAKIRMHWDVTPPFYVEPRVRERIVDSRLFLGGKRPMLLTLEFEARCVHFLDSSGGELCAAGEDTDHDTDPLPGEDLPGDVEINRYGIKPSGEIYTLAAADGSRLCIAQPAPEGLVTGRCRLAPAGQHFLALSPNAAWIVGRDGQKLCRWRLNDIDHLTRDACWTGLANPTTLDVRLVSTDGRRVIINQGPGQPIAFDLTTGRAHLPYQPLATDWERTALSATGNLIALGESASDYQSSTVSIWSISDDRRIARLNLSGRPLSLDFSPNSDALAIGMEHDRSVLIWRWKTDAMPMALPIGYPVQAVAFMPDGKSIVVAAGDRIEHYTQVTRWSLDITNQRQLLCRRIPAKRLADLLTRAGFLGEAAQICQNQSS